MLVLQIVGTLALLVACVTGYRLIDGAGGVAKLWKSFYETDPKLKPKDSNGQPVP